MMISASAVLKRMAWLYGSTKVSPVKPAHIQIMAFSVLSARVRCFISRNDRPNKVMAKAHNMRVSGMEVFANSGLSGQKY